jgi:hypothetical protein
MCLLIPWCLADMRGLRKTGWLSCQTEPWLKAAVKWRMSYGLRATMLLFYSVASSNAACALSNRAFCMGSGRERLRSKLSTCSLEGALASRVAQEIVFGFSGLCPRRGRNGSIADFVSEWSLFVVEFSAMHCQRLEWALSEVTWITLGSECSSCKPAMSG